MNYNIPDNLPVDDTLYRPEVQSMPIVTWHGKATDSNGDTGGRWAIKTEDLEGGRAAGDRNRQTPGGGGQRIRCAGDYEGASAIPRCQICGGGSAADAVNQRRLRTQGMDEDYKRRQEQAIADVIKSQDIVISTALIPGKPAPELITEAMVMSMKPGSVIVDLEAANGGNCHLTKKDARTVTENGVSQIGYTNMPSRAASDASPLYARNLQTFVMTLMFNKETKTLHVQSDDELVKGTLITKGGAVVHPMLAR